jgi:hypothetical protein
MTFLVDVLTVSLLCSMVISASPSSGKGDTSQSRLHWRAVSMIVLAFGLAAGLYLH